MKFVFNSIFLFFFLFFLYFSCNLSKDTEASNDNTIEKNEGDIIQNSNPNNKLKKSNNILNGLEQDNNEDTGEKDNAINKIIKSERKEDSIIQNVNSNINNNNKFKKSRNALNNHEKVKNEDIVLTHNSIKIDPSDIQKLLDFKSKIPKNPEYQYYIGNKLLGKEKTKLISKILNNYSDSKIKEIVKDLVFHKIYITKTDLIFHYSKKTHNCSVLINFINNCNHNSGKIQLATQNEFPLNESSISQENVSTDFANAMFGGGLNDKSNGQEEMLLITSCIIPILKKFIDFSNFQINDIGFLENLPQFARIPLKELYKKDVNRDNRIEKASKAVLKIKPKKIDCIVIDAPDQRNYRNSKGIWKNGKWKSNSDYHLYDKLFTSCVYLCKKFKKQIIWRNGRFGFDIFRNDHIAVIIFILLTRASLENYSRIDSSNLEIILHLGKGGKANFDKAKQILLASLNYFKNKNLDPTIKQIWKQCIIEGKKVGYIFPM